MKNKYTWREMYKNNKDIVEDALSAWARTIDDKDETATEDNRFVQAGVAIAFGEAMLTAINRDELTPTVKEAIKSIKEDIKTIKRQLDILSNPKNTLDTKEYLPKTLYSCMNMINQVFYLYMLYAENPNTPAVQAFIASSENVYSLADEIKSHTNDKRAFLGK